MAKMNRREIIELAICSAHDAIEQFNPTDDYCTVWGNRDNITDTLHEAGVTDPMLWDLAMSTYSRRVNYLARRAKLGRKFEI